MKRGSLESLGCDIKEFQRNATGQLHALFNAGLRGSHASFDSEDDDKKLLYADTEDFWHRVFNISRSEGANLSRLGLSNRGKVLPDKTMGKLMNSITPKGLGGGANFNWGGSSGDDDAEADGIASRKVRWSMFDIFENDLGPDERRPRVIHAASIFAQISFKLLTCICFWSTWYSTALFTYWDVLVDDVKWGRDTFLFSLFWSIDNACDTLFFIMTLLRTRTTVLDVLSCMETVRPRTLMMQELRSKGFWIDLLTCFPVTHLVIRHDAPQFLLVVKMARIRHILRRQRQSLVFEHDAMLILRLLSLVMLGGHLLSCFYFFTTYETKAYKRHPYFTLTKEIVTQGSYGFFDYYTFSLRAATYLILGADLEGYSDIENAGIFFCTLIGVIVNALVFSEIIIVISRRSLLETKTVEETNNTLEAMRTLDVPSSVQLRIFSHYVYDRVHKGHSTIVDLLGGISEQLNFELHLARHYRLVTAVPFFKRSHPYVLREIVLVLSDVVFLPGDWICRLGDEGKQMYFMHKGCCSVLSGVDAEACLRQVRQGDYFGEISLLTGVQRTAYVRADTFSMVAELSKDKFDGIMRRFPQELQVVVQGFTEEQKTLLLKIRQELHNPQPEQMSIAETPHHGYRDLALSRIVSDDHRDVAEPLPAHSTAAADAIIEPETGDESDDNANGTPEHRRQQSNESWRSEADPDVLRTSVHASFENLPGEANRRHSHMSHVRSSRRASHHSFSRRSSNASHLGRRASKHGRPSIRTSELTQGHMALPSAEPDGYVKAPSSCHTPEPEVSRQSTSSGSDRQSVQSQTGLNSVDASAFRAPRASAHADQAMSRSCSKQSSKSRSQPYESQEDSCHTESTGRQFFRKVVSIIKLTAVVPNSRRTSLAQGELGTGQLNAKNQEPEPDVTQSLKCSSDFYRNPRHSANMAPTSSSSASSSSFVRKMSVTSSASSNTFSSFGLRLNTGPNAEVQPSSSSNAFAPLPTSFEASSALPVVPAEEHVMPASPSAAAQRHRRPSMLGAMLGLGSPPAPGSPASSTPQGAAAGGLGGLFSNLAGKVVEGGQSIFGRRKSDPAVLANETGDVGVERQTSEGSAVPSMVSVDHDGPMCPIDSESNDSEEEAEVCGEGSEEDEKEEEVAKKLDLEAMERDMTKETDLCTDLRSHSMVADQMTTDIQSGHQAVYDGCARMEEIWLAKRQEFRDERRDIVTTLAHLATQVREAQEMLRSTLSLDNSHDVTMQAFNIVQSDQAASSFQDINRGSNSSWLEQANDNG